MLFFLWFGLFAVTYFRGKNKPKESLTLAMEYVRKKHENTILINPANISSAEVDNKDANVQTSVEEKLKELSNLKEKNLINDQEYTEKRERNTVMCFIIYLSTAAD